MRCPDCGLRLTEMRLSGGKFCYRCNRCGGFGLDSWTANRIEGSMLKNMRRISIDPVWLKGGKGICPLDKTYLTRYMGESIPEDVTVYRCIRCGKWWWPGDSLFRYKPAAEAKLRYYKLWGLKGDLQTLAIPILVLIILLCGLYVGVNLVAVFPEVIARAREIIDARF